MKPRTGPRPQIPEVLVCYNFTEGLTDQEELIYLEFELDLIPIGKLSLPQSPLPDSTIEPFQRALTYHTAIGDNDVDETSAKLEVQGQSLTSWEQLE